VNKEKDLKTDAANPRARSGAERIEEIAQSVQVERVAEEQRVL
jgi:hypothetical protein